MKQKKLSLGARFGLAVASFLLGLVLFAAAIASILITDLRLLTSKDGIRAIVYELISAPAHVQMHTPANPEPGAVHIAHRTGRYYAMPRRAETSGDTLGLTEQMISMLYKELANHIEGEVPITEESFTQIVNDSTIKDYVADKTASLVSDYFNDEVTTTFETEEIVQLVTENKELIESVTGEPLPEDFTDQVVTAVKKNELITKVEKEGLTPIIEAIANEPETDSGSNSGSNSGSDSGSSSEGEGGSSTSNPIPEKKPNAISNTAANIKNTVSLVRSVSSTGNLVWGIVICVVVLAAIILINIRQLSKGLRRCGYPLIFAGALLLLPTILLNTVSDLGATAADLLSMDASTITPIVKLIQKVLTMFVPASASVLALGVVLVISGTVTGIVLRKKRRAAVTVPVSAEAGELTEVLLEESAEEPIAEEICAEETSATVE